MKPRIFISSTFYDLKYIREDLANFVRAYNYEPILFEDGDIGYTPGKTLDKSCYESMRNADMVILIIGGEYGSPASGETRDEFKEYMSVTRNEFRTAIETGLPVFVMIDKKVMAEYDIYEANYDSIENKNVGIKFHATKNINVFRFIREIKGIVTLPIQEFEKSSDIKGFISKQWADMFKNYLASLRDEKENRKIENSVNEMKALIQKMDIMLDSVGKNVLTKEDPKEYDDVVNQQEIISFCESVSESFYMVMNEELNLKDIKIRRELVTEFLFVLKETFEKKIWEEKKLQNFINLNEIFKMFNRDRFRIEFIAFDFCVRIENKYTLLYDKERMNKIIEIMIEDKFLYRLLGMRY